jgi:hypothetical protein
MYFVGTDKLIITFIHRETITNRQMILKEKNKIGECHYLIQDLL